MTPIFLGSTLLLLLGLGNRPEHATLATLFSGGDSTQVVAFLDFLKSGEDAATADEGFEVEHGGHWPDGRLLQFLDSTVTFFDVNGDTSWFEAADAINARVKRRSGPAFTMFVHLGHIYGQPYPQYSRLSYERAGSRLIVSVADWYRLTFVRRGSKLLLTKLEYLTLEDH